MQRKATTWTDVENVYLCCCDMWCDDGDLTPNSCRRVLLLLLLLKMQYESHFSYEFIQCFSFMHNKFRAYTVVAALMGQIIYTEQSFFFL